MGLEFVRVDGEGVHGRAQGRVIRCQLRQLKIKIRLIVAPRLNGILIQDRAEIAKLLQVQPDFRGEGGRGGDVPDGGAPLPTGVKLRFSTTTLAEIALQIGTSCTMVIKVPVPGLASRWCRVKSSNLLKIRRPAPRQ